MEILLATIAVDIPQRLGLTLLMLLGVCLGSAAQADTRDQHIADLVARGDYDQQLCATTQLILLNAQPGDFNIKTLVAKDGTFITEQMDADHDTNTVTVAALLETISIGRQPLAIDMACKLINQDRANDVLGLRLQEPRGSCRDVNELTYQLALAGLTTEQRLHYLEAGTPLQFTEDYKAVAGGEWLPSVINDFIKPVGDADNPEAIEIQAPSVQVPWPSSGGDWYEGTHHCKLITLAAMSRWMTTGALRGDTELFPRPRLACTEPSSRSSAAGSCLLFFGPAGAQFCQDYSGSGWTHATAREDCKIRHPSKIAWNESGDKYDGGGGIFSTRSCAARGAIAEAREAPLSITDAANLGTCVFRCNTPDEALWHQLSRMPTDPEGRMMERTCDLFLHIPW